VDGLDKKRSARKKTIRYFRWAVKAAFLLIFTLPFAYFVTAPSLPVYSLFSGGLDQTPLLMLPYGQSVCSIFLVSFDTVGPGAWLICPVGGLQVLLTGKVTTLLLLPTIMALVLFLIPIFVLGNVFCGWLCPLGTLIDGFDKGVERFMPKLNMKREARSEQNKEKKKAKHSVVCPTCPFGKLLGDKHANVANGVLVSALVGSAVFQFPVFCAICPIGISTKGMFHLKALTSVTGRMMPIILELWAIPVIAILASLRMKRYWCRKICPVGASLNLAGAFSPLIKPTVKTEKCVMKGCPETCEDYHLDYCGACRQIDQKRCEKVCPQGINLLDKGSLARCTKCLECYIQCEHDSIEIKLFGTPDAFATLRRLKAKLKRQPKNVAKPDKN
jgi:ferredoxin-type protein NapH